MAAVAAMAVMSAQAQDSNVETQTLGVVVSPHALVDVVNTSLVFNFAGDTPTEAGDGLVLGAGKTQSTFLNYSLMKANGALNNAGIAVRVSGVKAGMKVGLLVDGTAAAGLSSATHGVLGTVAAAFDATAGGNQPVELTGADQTIIENIGSSYTGDGAGNGYELRYTLTMDNYAAMDADNGSQDVATVTYTIFQ